MILQVEELLSNFDMSNKQALEIQSSRKLKKNEHFP